MWVLGLWRNIGVDFESKYNKSVIIIALNRKSNSPFSYNENILKVYGIDIVINFESK